MDLPLINAYLVMCVGSFRIFLMKSYYTALIFKVTVFQWIVTTEIAKVKQNVP